MSRRMDGELPTRVALVCCVAAASAVPDVHVLANVDESSYDPARTVKMGDHPVIWTNPHYKARNVYFQFGHKGALLQNTYFTQLFLNSIRWAAGQ